MPTRRHRLTAEPTDLMVLAAHTVAGRGVTRRRGAPSPPSPRPALGAFGHGVSEAGTGRLSLTRSSAMSDFLSIRRRSPVLFVRRGGHMIEAAPLTASAVVAMRPPAATATPQPSTMPRSMTP